MNIGERKIITFDGELVDGQKYTLRFRVLYGQAAVDARAAMMRYAKKLTGNKEQRQALESGDVSVDRMNELMAGNIDMCADMLKRVLILDSTEPTDDPDWWRNAVVNTELHVAGSSCHAAVMRAIGIGRSMRANEDAAALGFSSGVKQDVARQS